MTYLHYYYYMYIATLVHVEKGSFWWGYFEMDHSYLTNGSISKLIRLLGTLSIIYNTENNIMLCPAEASLLSEYSSSTRNSNPTLMKKKEQESTI